MDQKTEIRIFISSPEDLDVERGFVEKAARELNDELDPGLGIKVTTVQSRDFEPAAGSPQDVIDARIGTYSVFLGVMADKFGTPTKGYGSGTQYEFESAYKSWRKSGSPEIMFYFREIQRAPSSAADAEQIFQILRFREEISNRVLHKSYSTHDDFSEFIFQDLLSTVTRLAERLAEPESTRQAIQERSERVISANMENLQESWSRSRYASSFVPGGSREDHRFYMARIGTTSGFVKNSKGKLESRLNSVTIIKDPIRPFDIQIGETRALRQEGEARAVPDLENLDLGAVKGMYPFFQVEGYKWIRMVLAELATDPKILDHIYSIETDPQVKAIVARNPSARSELQEEDCLFCNQDFRHRRRLDIPGDHTLVFQNDFPYGPYFHYIALPSRPVHAWQEIELSDLMDLNSTIWNFLRLGMDAKKWLPEPAGVFVGLNSSIRHLVMGTRTRTSAGASISHIHKQIWGMAPGSVNLGAYLNDICQEYTHASDYLDAYCEFLRDEGMVIFEDDNVVLYIPFGQISTHELQVMVKHPGKTDFLALSEDDVDSLSKAEAIAIKLLDALGIHSFNEIMLTLPFKSDSKRFRIVMCFLTREVDLAVSELNQLFVVDHYPEDTKRMVMPFKEHIKKEVLGGE